MNNNLQVQSVNYAKWFKDLFSGLMVLGTKPITNWKKATQKMKLPQKSEVHLLLPIGRGS